MRTRTFVFSFFVHTLVIGAAMVVRLFATTELPAPPQSTMFAMVTAEVPEVQPPPAPPTRVAQTPVVNPDAAPLTEPTSIASEPPVAFDTVPNGPGVVLGLISEPAGDGLGIAPPRPLDAPPNRRHPCVSAVCFVRRRKCTTSRRRIRPSHRRPRSPAS